MTVEIALLFELNCKIDHFLSDFEAQLASIDADIKQIDNAIERLSTKKQKLLSKKQQIKQRLQECASEELANQDWERSGILIILYYKTSPFLFCLDSNKII